MAAKTPEEIAKISEQIVGGFFGPGGRFELEDATWPIGSPGKEKMMTGKVFKNTWRNLRAFYDDSFAKYNHRTFIVNDNERITFGEVWRRASALGHQLVVQFGVNAGDRVAVSMRNYPEWCIGWIAATAIGGVVVPLNSWWKGEELKYGLQDSGSKVIICDEARLQRVLPFLDEIGCAGIVVRADAPPGAFAWSEVLTAGAGQACPNRDRGPDEYAAIMYTSGSTGHPKGVVLTHRGICSQETWPLFYEAMAKASWDAGLLPEKPPSTGVVVCPVPLFHATASHHIFMSNLAGGGRIILMPKWDAGMALKIIQREKPTSWLGVPTMIQDLMEHPDFDKTDTSTMGRMGGGGAPTPTSQVGKTNKKFKGSAGNGYGLTETNGGICGIGGEEYVQHPTSCGKANPITEVIVIDPETRKVLPAGEPGELLIKGVLVMSHYWNKPQKTSDEIIELDGLGAGWFRSGDIAEVDAEGYIYIRDRVKDIIIRGGENISCAEVESGFFQHCGEQILECAAFGVKDERLGEIVGLMVVLKPGETATADGLVGAVKKAGNLASFKIPKVKDVFFSSDILPRTASGKIMKRVIRDKVNAQLALGNKQKIFAKL